MNSFMQRTREGMQALAESILLAAVEPERLAAIAASDVSSFTRLLPFLPPAYKVTEPAVFALQALNVELRRHNPSHPVRSQRQQAVAHVTAAALLLAGLGSRGSSLALFGTAIALTGPSDKIPALGTSHGLNLVLASHALAWARRRMQPGFARRAVSSVEPGFRLIAYQLLADGLTRR